MDPNTEKQIKGWIDEGDHKVADFVTRKRGDTPTDATQLTPQMYVDLNGAIGSRPKDPNPGQRYYVTELHYPIFTDGISSWFSATGSIVAAL